MFWLDISDSFDKSSGTAFGKRNVIAQQTKVTGDLRALSNQQVIKAQQRMQQIVCNNLNQTSATLEFLAGNPPMALTRGDQQLLALYSQASQDLGYNKVVANPRKAGAADISFAVDHVVMSLDGLGLMGQGAHTKNEVADLTSLKMNIEKTALLIYRLTNTE